MLDRLLCNPKELDPEIMIAITTFSKGTRNGYVSALDTKAEHWVPSNSNHKHWMVMSDVLRIVRGHEAFARASASACGAQDWAVVLVVSGDGAPDLEELPVQGLVRMERILHDDHVATSLA